MTETICYTKDMENVMQTLDLPNLDDLNLNLSAKNAMSITKVRPANWDETLAAEYSHKSLDTTGWTYLSNFRKLNFYEAMFYTCSCCAGPIRQCINNETLHFKAEDWQKYYKEHNMSANPNQTEDTTEDAVIEDGAKPGRTSDTNRRQKGSFAQSMTSDEAVRTSVVEAYNSPGASIASLSTQFMIAPKAIREYLSEEGVLRGRGQGVQRKSTRVRKTLAVTPEILEQARGMYQEVGGVVKTASILNCNAVELSAALQASGEKIQRGRKTKTPVTV